MQFIFQLIGKLLMDFLLVINNCTFFRWCYGFSDSEYRLEVGVFEGSGWPKISGKVKGTSPTNYLYRPTHLDRPVDALQLFPLKVFAQRNFVADFFYENRLLRF